MYMLTKTHVWESFLKICFIFKLCGHVCVSVGTCAYVSSGVHRGQREQWNPKTGVTDGCELSDVGAGD